MNAETLRALKGSIRKWEQIVIGKGVDERSNNCPLCKLFISKECEDCPVADKGFPVCYGSPWTSWIDHMLFQHWNEVTQFRVYCPICKHLAQKELDFLRNLLPEKKKRRKA